MDSIIPNVSPSLDGPHFVFSQLPNSIELTSIVMNPRLLLAELDIRFQTEPVKFLLKYHSDQNRSSIAPFSTKRWRTLDTQSR